MALVVAVMENPVLRLALRIERALHGHVGGKGRQVGVSAVAINRAPVARRGRDTVVIGISFGAGLQYFQTGESRRAACQAARRRSAGYSANT